MTEARTYMDGYTDLLEQAFEINLNNYGPEDVERLNDWAINAYAALEALQAEVKHLNLHLKATQSGRDAALARLSKIERQEPVAEMTLVDMGIGDARQLRVNWLMDGYLDVGAKLYASAGASPVEPSQTQPVFVSESLGHLTASGVPKTIDQFQLALNAAFAAGKVVGASPQPKMVTPYITQEHFDKAFPVNVPPSQAQPPAPSEAAREYMTGYSDGREWAKPSQALELSDDEIDALLPTITLKGLDPKQQVWLTKKDAIAFARAIIAAIKQGGQHG